jgi:hypothetical protein
MEQMEIHCLIFDYGSFTQVVEGKRIHLREQILPLSLFNITG